MNFLFHHLNKLVFYHSFNMALLLPHEIFLHDDVRIKAHFLICFLALVIYRYLERDLGNAFSYEAILDKLRTMNIIIGCFICHIKL